MGTAEHERSDEDLLLAARDEPEAFGLFYRRHVRALAAYFWRRSRDAEETADLTAETFAAALDGCARFDPGRGPAIGWLYGIAHRQLGTLHRRGAVEQRARRRMGMARLQLDDEELERVEADAVLEGPQARVLQELAELPAEQRAAVEARVFLRAARRRRAAPGERRDPRAPMAGVRGSPRRGVVGRVCGPRHPGWRPAGAVGGTAACVRAEGRRQRGADAGESHTCARGADGRGRAGRRKGRGVQRHDAVGAGAGGRKRSATAGRAARGRRLRPRPGAAAYDRPVSTWFAGTGASGRTRPRRARDRAVDERRCGTGAAGRGRRQRRIRPLRRGGQVFDVPTRGALTIRRRSPSRCATGRTHGCDLRLCR